MSNAGPFLIGGDGSTGHTSSTIVDNSVAVKVGDVIANVIASNVEYTRRYNAAGDSVLGVLISVVDPSTGGQAVPDSGTTDTWTVAADNRTVGKKYAVIDASPHSIWSAPLDGTIHTTQAARRGTFFDADTAANAGRIAEASATRTITNGRSFTCHGVDPDSSTRVLVSIAESYLLPKGDS